jgi:hypothetical protein
MTKLIGLTGRAQHGKDTSGALLVERYGFRKLAFADSLREAVATLNPIIPLAAGPIRYTDLLDAVGYEEAKKEPEVRRLLQVMGTEVGRNIFGQDCWVQALALRLQDDPRPPEEQRTVVTDVRFPNEAAAIRQWGGKVIRVRRLDGQNGEPFDSGIDRNHPSEAFVDSLPVDYEFDAWDVLGVQDAISVIADYELGEGSFNVAEAGA